MPETPETPRPTRGPSSLGKKWHGMPLGAWYGLGGVVLIGGFILYKRRKASAAATTPASATASGANSIDPATGVPYATELSAAQAAGAQAYGSSPYGGSGGGGGSYGTGDYGSAPLPPSGVQTPSSPAPAPAAVMSAPVAGPAGWNTTAANAWSPTSVAAGQQAYNTFAAGIPATAPSGWSSQSGLTFAQDQAGFAQNSANTVAQYSQYWGHNLDPTYLPGGSNYR